MHTRLFALAAFSLCLSACQPSAEDRATAGSGEDSSAAGSSENGDSADLQEEESSAEPIENSTSDVSSEDNSSSESSEDSSSASADSRRPYGGNPHTIPGKIETEDYDEGAPGEVYHDEDEKNHGADYRGVTQVDIEERDDASNGYGIGWIKAGEWVSYSVVVEESGTYNVEFPVGSGGKGGTFHLEIDGKDVSGPIQVPDTGSFHKLQTITAENVQLEKGNYILKMVMDSDGETGWVADIDSMHFVKQSM